MNLLSVRTVSFNTPLFFDGKKWSGLSTLERAALFLVILSPVFFLSIRHWISNVSVLAALLSIAVLYRRRNEIRFLQIPTIKTMALLFSAYALGILISQLGRQTFVTREYLDQTRWLLGLPCFALLVAYKVNYLAALERALPVSIFAAWIGVTYFPSNAWGDRQTISFIDPLTFGHLNLTLGLMCFVAAMFDVARKNIGPNTLFKLAAFAVGVLLSIQSGSRTGWLAVPFVLCIVFYQIYKPGPAKLIGLVLAVLAALWLLVSLNTDMSVRFNQLVNETLTYPWQGGFAPDTSVAMRITFYRMGYYYFSQSPLFGWGNRGYADIKDAVELLSFSSQYARDFAFDSLFHSDLTTQTVRYGVFGLLSVFIVFFIPISAFSRALGAGGDLQKTACMGLTFTLCLLGSSLSTEVFDSKGMTTLTAFILAGLLADIVSRQALSE